jgi:hypothetical protein
MVLVPTSKIVLVRWFKRALSARCAAVLELLGVRKIARIAAGFLLLAVGLILAIPGVPGPGLAVMAVGLILLAEHFHWARRTLDWVKGKAERLRDRVAGRPAPKA